MSRLTAWISDEAAVATEPSVGLDRYIRLSRIAALALVLLLLFLGGVVQLTSAVAAYGDVSVASKVKKLSHPSGGILSALYVRDGDKVKAGQLLMRFDTTVSGVSAEVSGKNLDQLMAIQARLSAERDGRAVIAFPPELAGRNTPAARAAMAEEQRLFVIRRTGRAGMHLQLGQRISQSEQQIASYQTQLGAARAQSQLIEPELKGIRSLYARQLTTINRVNELERTAVALTATAASLQAQIAQARAQIGELRQQAIQVDEDARAQAGNELNDVIGKVADQTVRQATTSDALQRSVVRAPQSGTVDKLAFTTVGSVVPPAQTILEIVPDSDRLTVDAKISPTDVDQVHPGQPAQLRFSAFNVRTTPEIAGTVRTVSAERQIDEKSGSSFYTVLIDLSPGEIRKLGKLQLVPGMPVEAYIRTGRRSMLSYLLKPLSDQFSRSFRQD